MVKKEIIEKARKQALKVDGYLYKHGAVIFNGNDILATGHNMRRFVPHLRTIGYKYVWHHAESHAILKAAPEDLKGASIIIVRLGHKNRLANSKPCAHCMGLIKESGIREVFYSSTQGKLECIKL